MKNWKTGGEYFQVLTRAAAEPGHNLSAMPILETLGRCWI